MNDDKVTNDLYLGKWCKKRGRYITQSEQDDCLTCENYPCGADWEMVNE